MSEQVIARLDLVKLAGQFFEGLGIDPKNVLSAHLNPTEIIIERIDMDEDGKRLVKTNESGEPSLVTSLIRIRVV